MTGLMVTEPKQAVELWIFGVNNRDSRILEYFVSYGKTCEICFHIVQYG